jgi:hypothetical protein
LEQKAREVKMPKLKITKANVDALPFSVAGQIMYLDTELRGFTKVNILSKRQILFITPSYQLL